MNRIFLALLVLNIHRIGYSSCAEQPIVLLDTLESGNIEAQFDFGQFESFKNYVDTIPGTYLIQWLVELYENMEYSFHGRISSALFSADTIVSEIDTIVGCSDLVYDISQGQEYALGQFKTKIKVLRVYKGSIDTNMIEITEEDIFPFECVSDLNNFENPYSLLLNEEFIFFNDELDKFPETGPYPYYSMKCQVKNGFFIDSMKNISKVGTLRNGYIKMYSGSPGFSITLDSLQWYFDNFTGITPSIGSEIRLRKYYLNRGNMLMLMDFDKSYMINGRKFPNPDYN